ncbi:hypothetical protein KFK09_007049 [Dendrobium nobile]|uniref:Damage-control phosphatase ARMT1-like metal-binding domain-containing protein n=1 Tax=Dendrobium nobile TaxID=94219 RepID=A0A8T3BR54_DENNO|nr:hypothetical protein KFK09_007049 [Dendrobium nobile]
MESSSPSVPFPLLQTPVEANYRACTIPYRFLSDNPRKATPIEIQWIDLFLNSVPSFRQRAENDPTVIDAPEKAEKFAQRYTEILEDMKKDPESHGGPPDCILLCRLREQALREFGFRDIFKKVKDEENAKAISLFEDVVRRNDAIDEGNRVENLIRGVLAGNIFDLGSAQLVVWLVVGIRSGGHKMPKLYWEENVKLANGYYERPKDTRILPFLRRSPVLKTLSYPVNLKYLGSVFSVHPLAAGFDAIKERIGVGHNRYFVVPFGGKTTRFRGSQIFGFFDFGAGKALIVCEPLQLRSTFNTAIIGTEVDYRILHLLKSLCIYPWVGERLAVEDFSQEEAEENSARSGRGSAWGRCWLGLRRSEEGIRIESKRRSAEEVGELVIVEALNEISKNPSLCLHRSLDIYIIFSIVDIFALGQVEIHDGAASDPAIFGRVGFDLYTHSGFRLELWELCFPTLISLKLVDLEFSFVVENLEPTYIW